MLSVIMDRQKHENIRVTLPSCCRYTALVTAKYETAFFKLLVTCLDIQLHAITKLFEVKWFGTFKLYFKKQCCYSSTLKYMCVKNWGFLSNNQSPFNKKSPAGHGRRSASYLIKSPFTICEPCV